MKDNISKIVQEIVKILNNNEPTIYLFGSVVFDDFKLGWSDIDFICLTEKPINETQAEELLYLRQKLVAETDNKTFRSFEGIFTALDVCCKKNNDTVVYWGTSGERLLDSFTLDVFTKIGLIKYGKLVYGKDKLNRFSLPTNYEIYSAVENVAETISKYAVETDSHFYSAGWLFDIARCFYTLETNDIISKTEAGKWALSKSLCPEPEIMELALKIRERPANYINDSETQKWLSELGPHIQLFNEKLKIALKDLHLS